jgi:serine O-acetyltransferase
MTIKALICKDIEANCLVRIRETCSGLRLVALVAMWMIRSVGLRAVLFYRASRWLYTHGRRIAAKTLSRIGTSLTRAEISCQAKIGPGLDLAHPFGVIIGGETVIGSHCKIGQYVTLGGNLGKVSPTGQEYPHIGDRVTILAGSVVAGPVQIGDDVIIGANCVVTKSVPDGVTIKPARPVCYARSLQAASQTTAGK